MSVLKTSFILVLHLQRTSLIDQVLFFCSLVNFIFDFVCNEMASFFNFDGQIGGVINNFEASYPLQGTEMVTVTSAVPQSPLGQFCIICGDKATGKHYGAFSCDGCKGFFRRSVRDNKKYHCRSQKACVISLEQRNQCRYCRLEKCLNAGMKMQAVQVERDRISNRQMPVEEEIDTSGLSLSILLRGESLMNETQKENVNDNGRPVMEINNIQEILDSITGQLFNLISWSRSIPAYKKLSSQDQVALLQGNFSQVLLLGLAKRSMQLEDTLLLANNRIYRRQNPESGNLLGPVITTLANQTLEEIVQEFRALGIDENEFVLLKAIVFFNPYSRGLQEKERIRDLQSNIMLNLEQYIGMNQYSARGRNSKILQLLRQLENISVRFLDYIKTIQSNLALRIDPLLGEIFWNDNSSTPILHNLFYLIDPPNDCPPSPPPEPIQEESTTFLVEEAATSVDFYSFLLM